MKPDELKTGHVYFFCGWSNSKYPVPVITTYVYIGKNLNQDGKYTSQNEYIFEDQTKYFEKEILEGLSEAERKEYDGPEEPYRMTMRDDSLNTIQDIDGLIDFLMLSKKQSNAKDIL